MLLATKQFRSMRDMENTAEVVQVALGDIDFDPDQLKAKYLAERDKRLRSDANEQYVEVAGDFSTTWMTHTKLRLNANRSSIR